MKNLRNSLSVLFLLIFVGNFSGIAQTSVKDVKGAKDVNKEVRDQVSNTKEAAEKAAKQTADKSATSVSDMSEEKTDAYKKKLDAASSPEQRKKMENAMKNELDANKKAKEVLKDKKNDLKKSSATDVKKVTSYSDLKGRALGNAKATDAIKMIDSKKSDLAKRDSYVAASKGRVSAAKAKVNADLASDAITKEQAADKFAKIAKVEKSLNEYETKLKASGKKLTDRSNTVSDYIKN